MNMKTQMQMFYESQLYIANKNHLKMAELQTKAGQYKLAFESRKTALARRIASHNITREGNIINALRFGQEAASVLTVDNCGL